MQEQTQSLREERVTATMVAPTVTTVRGGRAARPLVPFGIVVLLFTLLVSFSFVLSEAQLLDLRSVFVLALFAVATNLLLGYGGLVSFGQASFYGLGAYVVALGWLHYQWPFWLSFLLAPAIGGLAALAVGALALRTRRLYFSLLTLAFSQLFFTIALKWYSFTQGDNGIFSRRMVPEGLRDPQMGYLFTLVVVAVSMLILWKITVSPFGLTLRAIRENRGRAEALGVNVYWHQLQAFVISGAFCALAGVLFVVKDQGAVPQMLEWTKSGDPVLAAVIGGMFSFLGPALGALVYQYGHDWIVQYTTHWQLVLGIVLLTVVLFAPDGLLGLFSTRDWRTRWMRLRSRIRREEVE